MFTSETDMQSTFTPFLKKGGVADYPNAVFELKHLTCHGLRTCTADQCGGRLAFQQGGHHEAGQATDLLRALGLSADGTASAYKLSDEARGKKPYDCYRFAKADGAFFVVGYSCQVAGFDAYLVPALGIARFIAAGGRGLRATDCVACGGVSARARGRAGAWARGWACVRVRA